LRRAARAAVVFFLPVLFGFFAVVVFEDFFAGAFRVAISVVPGRVRQ
jgi:hypothetical protein